MLWVLTSLGGGVLHGLILQRFQKKAFLRILDKSIMPTLAIFLIIIGISVGSDFQVMQNLTTLGLHSLMIALASIVGSILFVPIIRKFLRSNTSKQSFISQEYRSDNNGRSLSYPTARRAGSFVSPHLMKSLQGLITSAALLSFFAGGIFAGYFLQPWVKPQLIMTMILGALFVLLWVVGATIGGDEKAMKLMRSAHPSIFLVPLFVAIGSLIGAALMSKMLPNFTPCKAMSVSAGMGLYSLSSAIVTQADGPMLGTTALIVNLFREVFTIGMAPIIVKLFGPLALIATGATTTCSSTLPVICLCAGKDYTTLAFMSGMTLNLTSPFLVMSLVNM